MLMPKSAKVWTRSFKLGSVWLAVRKNGRGLGGEGARGRGDRMEEEEGGGSRRREGGGEGERRKEAGEGGHGKDGGGGAMRSIGQGGRRTKESVRERRNRRRRVCGRYNSVVSTVYAFTFY